MYKLLAFKLWQRTNFPLKTRQRNQSTKTSREWETLFNESEFRSDYVLSYGKGISIFSFNWLGITSKCGITAHSIEFSYGRRFKHQIIWKRSKDSVQLSFSSTCFYYKGKVMWPHAIHDCRSALTFRMFYNAKENFNILCSHWKERWNRSS
jgi:hypothetical protein